MKSMKSISIRSGLFGIRGIAVSLLVATGTVASAASLQLNFRVDNTNANAAIRNDDVADDYRTLSPAHDTGALSGSDLTWNNFTSTASSSSLFYSNGTAATGVSITFGQETAVGTGIIGLGTTGAVNTANLHGSGGGTAGQLSLTSQADSIYGQGNVLANTAPGRGGWLAGASGAGSGLALGLRVDGLAAGDYTIFVMSRNTSANASDAPMEIYTSTGAVSTTFDLSTAFASETQSNVVYPNTNLTAYNTFIDGENYVALNVTIGENESLFIASDGLGSEYRGILNMVQIVQIPEPSVTLLGALGAFALLRRRRD